MNLIIEPLGPQHDRAKFTCGDPGLDDWFRRRAGQDERRRVARIFVASDAELGVVGFYSLSSFSFGISDLPPDLARRLPRYGDVPAALIGRLARHEAVRGRGVGGVLLADAVLRVLSISQSMGILAIVVDAAGDGAASFYQRFGFTSFPSRPGRLFLPLETARVALSAD